MSEVAARLKLKKPPKAEKSHIKTIQTDIPWTIRLSRNYAKIETKNILVSSKNSQDANVQKSLEQSCDSDSNSGNDSGSDSGSVSDNSSGISDSDS